MLPLRRRIEQKSKSGEKKTSHKLFVCGKPEKRTKLKMSMFAVIVSGRLVQTNFEAVDTSKFLLTIPDADNINHIVVFLTGSNPLPLGYAACVYFSWPDPNAPPTWIYLGYISNDKPSAIFRISKLKVGADAPAINAFGYSQPIVSHVAQIGISIEPSAQIEQMTPDPSVSPPNMDSYALFATKTAENLFNYVVSFAQSIVPNSDEQFIPLSCVRQWYENFLRKLQFDPDFWKR
ncbi:protein OPI10-like protein [Dinothrombium tinctorium]|uniref:Protein OPI10-like protein n=1 Tax=Dinothrombium tinctorium TaxID=1965070 RepID=A0A443RM57_9ACAR|nr:protein OPI10-like protein [Dinothrombium tinctorium]